MRWSAGNLHGVPLGGEPMKFVTRPAAAAALAVALVACNPGPNPTDEVNKALKQANLNEVSVDWDGGARVAHLRGRVDQPTDRQRAEEVAAAAVGTTGKVLNEVTIKGLTEKTAGALDDDIESTLKKMVDNDPVLRDRSVKFDVNNGAVTVKGDVQTADEKAKLTQLVHAAPGVKDFVNAVEIKPKS
jgi:osmotically-inducible protein OsmY